MRSIFTILFFISFFVINSCNKAPSTAPEITTKITGKITDKQTTQPIPGAQITTNPTTSSVTTDNTGTYTIPEINKGQYVVTATKDGYKNTSINVDVNEGKTVTADIQLELIKPELAVSVTSIDFGTTLSSATFILSNTTSIGTINYSIAKSVDWISLSPTSGTISDGVATINITASRTNLSFGNYNTTISITSDGGHKDIPVTMTIANPNSPQLTVSPLLLDFGTELSQLSFSIRNSGTGKISWVASSSQQWISVLPNSDSTISEVDQVNVEINRNNLPSADYTGEINIVSNVGSQTISVKMKVSTTPKLNLSKNNLDFGSTDTQQSFLVSNVGDGTLNWNASWNQSWITVTPTSGKNTGTVNVTINRDGQSAGNYYGIVFVTSNGGNDSVTIQMNAINSPQNYSLEDMTILKGHYTREPNTIIRGIAYPNSYFFNDEYIDVRLLKEFKLLKMKVGVDDGAGLGGYKNFTIKDDQGNTLFSAKAEPLKDPIIIEADISRAEWIEINAVDYNGQSRNYIRWIDIEFTK